VGVARGCGAGGVDAVAVGDRKLVGICSQLAIVGVAYQTVSVVPSRLLFVVVLVILICGFFSVMEKQHEFDATQIFSDLGKHKKINLVKLGFYMVLFFVFLYRFVLSLVQGAFKRPKSSFS
jgi:hypothetical protein